MNMRMNCVRHRPANGLLGRPIGIYKKKNLVTLFPRKTFSKPNVTHLKKRKLKIIELLFFIKVINCLYVHFKISYIF